MTFLRRTIQDILAHSFLNGITIITIAFSVLIVSTIILFLNNAENILRSWTEGIRIMAYLKPDATEQHVKELQQKMQSLPGVDKVTFISKEDAMDHLKTQMKHQASLFETLHVNPLPDAFEIQMIEALKNWSQFETTAGAIEAFPLIQEVEYGQKWLGRLRDFLHLFQISGIVMTALFVLAAIFFVANTIRLVLYARQDEVEVMSLVGASDAFIKMPFYLQSLIQGAIGGAIGLAIIYFIFQFIAEFMEQGMSSFLFQIQFLTPQTITAILCGSIVVGWSGCFISLRQFLK